MKRIVGSREMKEFDRNTIEKMGIPSCVLMERAALKVVQELEKGFLRRKQKEKILCVCGSGNNGGDGIAIARILYLHGFDAEIYLLGNPLRRSEEMKRQLTIAENYHIPVVNNLETKEYTTIVDAIFGVGLSRPVEGQYRDVICQLNKMDAWKIAVDLPSGIDGDTGVELGIAFRADLTITFGFCKSGLCLYPGKKIAGEIVIADVGIYAPLEIQDTAWLLEEKDIKQLPDKVVDGNKGTFGKVLIVAGSHGMCGAAYLSAFGAFAAGVGMVRIFTVEENRVPLQTMLPEAMISCGEDYWQAFDWCDQLVVGPGVGTDAASAKKVMWFLKAAFEAEKPMVLDADGLNLLSAYPEWRAYLSSQVILTPHMGEMSRLTGKTIKEIQNERIRSAREFAAETGSVCVLKDASTVVAAPDGRIWICCTGNPGMATAGSGDVLTGLLAGVNCMYLSQKDMDTGRNTALGVLLHGIGGNIASEEKGMAGMKAGDIAYGASIALKNKQNTRISEVFR